MTPGSVRTSTQNQSTQNQSTQNHQRVRRIETRDVKQLKQGFGERQLKAPSQDHGTSGVVHRLGKYKADPVAELGPGYVLYAKGASAKGAPGFQQGLKVTRHEDEQRGRFHTP